MAFDSLDPVSQAALFAAAVAAWVLAAGQRPRARLYLRFAALLGAALAACAALPLKMSGLGDAAALFLLPLMSAALMIAALARHARPLHDFSASLVLVTALASGLAALLWGIAVLALVPVLACALVLSAAALNRMAASAALSGAALAAGGLAALAQGAHGGLFLLVGAALVGMARAPVVPSVAAIDAAGEGRGRAAIGSLR